MNDQLDELAQEVIRKVACSICGGDGLSSLDCLCHGGGMASKGCSPCEPCKTEGEILDPQLANLREVPWEECQCMHCWPGTQNRVRRNMDGWPKGALAGALLFAVYGTPWEEAVDNADPQNNTDDPDFAILSAVLSALKAKA